jgi:uncharacterized protein (TIGR00255 family)
VIASMTGFGRAHFELDGVAFAVEVRTVNHRHLDVSVRLPRLASVAELSVRRRVQGRFARGKVDVVVSLPPGAGAGHAAVELDPEVARRYLDYAASLGRERGVSGVLDVGVLLGLPGVARLVEHALSEEALEAALGRAVDEAAAAAAAMRRAEGERLAAEIGERLEVVAGLVGSLAERADAVLETARERLRKRTDQLRRETGLLDEARLHQEIVIAVDRLDVTEEIVRLRSHLEQFRAILAEAGPGAPVGRRLDFLLQEFAREANTLGAKAGDAGIAHLVVDLKTELERIREQVQNVE